MTAKKRLILRPTAFVQWFRGHFGSRKSWIFATNNPQGARLLLDIKTTFYADEKADDFETSVVPARPLGLGLITVCCAAKRRMLPDHLAAVLRRHSLPVPTKDLCDRDVFVFADAEDVAPIANLLLNLYEATPEDLAALDPPEGGDS